MFSQNTKEWFKTAFPAITFITGCFIRAIPMAMLILVAFYYIGDWCVRKIMGWRLPDLTTPEACVQQDIFATKGAEYLIVIVYLICFLFVAYYTNPNRCKRQQTEKKPEQLDLFQD